MNPTPKNRFRGALIGIVLGPIYCLQHESLRRVSRPSAAESTRLNGLTPVAEAWLDQAWATLETAGELALEAWPGGEAEREETAGTEGDATAESMELQCLKLLPSLLLRSPWLSGQQQSLGRHLWAANRLPMEQAGLGAILAEVEQSLEGLTHPGDLALMAWLNSSEDGLRGASLRADLAQAHGRLGSQLIALNWGASQGDMSLPWRAKAWLGTSHSQLLRLGDRLYGAWAGQAAFEKLGVS